jgi:RNA polymerase sigma-70 factor, ECF subfamily
MKSTDSFSDMMVRLRAGDDDAATRVFRRFSHQLIGLARRQFDTILGARVDPEDVVQSAYKSFFVRYGDGQYEIADWNSLWGLLTCITVRKCIRRVEYYRAEARDPRREVAPPRESESGGWEAMDREPRPEEAAMLTETVQQLLDGLEKPEREIVELSLQGFTTQEISERLGRAERSVRRVRERVREWLEELSGSYEHE